MRSRHGPPSFRSIYKTFGPTSPGELLPSSTASPAMYILSYPGIAFKFPVPSNIGVSPSDKDLLNLLHKTEPPCLTSSLVIYSGESWADFRSALNQVKARIDCKKKKKHENTAKDSDQVKFAEIFPNEKIQVAFESGKSVSLAYGTFTAQDAITLLGPPSELYTKSDTRLNIHNKNNTRHEIETGSLSQGNTLFRFKD